MPLRFTKVERVTFEEDRQREALYWASKTIEERVLAGWALADNNLLAPPPLLSEDRKCRILRRVPRPKL